MSFGFVNSEGKLISTAGNVNKKLVPDVEICANYAQKVVQDETQFNISTTDDLPTIVGKVTDGYSIVRTMNKTEFPNFGFATNDDSDHMVEIKKIKDKNYSVIKDTVINTGEMYAGVYIGDKFEGWNKVLYEKDIDDKVDKVDGKGLSTNDFNDEYKDKLDTIADSAEVNVQSDWNVTDVDSDAFIKNKPTSLPASDVNDWAKAATKPAYTASEVGADPSGSANSALTSAKAYTDTIANNKVDKVTGKGLSTNDLTDELKSTYDTAVSDVNVLKGTGAGSVTKTVTDEIAKIVANAPEDLDTLKEISDWIGSHESDASAMNTAIQGKVDKVTGKGLSTNDFTTAYKNKLDGIATGATANVGTITGIKMNGSSKGTSGVVDLGTVLTGGSQTSTSSADGGSNIYTFSDGTTMTVKNGSKGNTGATGATGPVGPTGPGLNGATLTNELKLSFGNSVANGSYIPTSTTLEEICSELSLSSGCSGSISLSTAYSYLGMYVKEGWYNYIWIPHRTGGKNGAPSGDNCLYGTLLLYGMVSNNIYKHSYRVIWGGNKIISIEMTSSGSDTFTNTLLANHIGRLFVYSCTKGDRVTTLGRSAINNTGAKSIITKGFWSMDDADQYGGHIIISTEGAGSWLDDDANDNYGLNETPSKFMTPSGNTVYMFYMAGSWHCNNYPEVKVTLTNGDQFSINDSCGFINYPHTLKMILSIADTVLFESVGNVLQNVNRRTHAESLKNFFPSSRPTSANISLGNGGLQYFHATSDMTEGKPPADSCILHMAWDNTGGWDEQVAVANDAMYFRSQSSGTWQAWRTLLDNYGNQYVHGSFNFDSSKNGLTYSNNLNMISNSTLNGNMYSSADKSSTSQYGVWVGNGMDNTRISANGYLYLAAGYVSASTSISTASDEKIKTFTDDIQTDEEKLIKLFDIINPKSYNYKYLSTDKLHIGFSAQEVEKSFKELDIDPEKYSILDIQYNYMLTRGNGEEEDFKYYTKYMSISYTDLHNLAMLKIKDMEEKHTARLTAIENTLQQLLNSSNGGTN